MNTTLAQSQGQEICWRRAETVVRDRCYCERCYLASWEDTIASEGPTPYVVPRGWCRFGLVFGSEVKARTEDVFNKWSASFHGVKSKPVLLSILKCGQLMKPGDGLLDGTKLRSTKCAGRRAAVFYTSPTVEYAGLKFYAEPQPYGGGRRAHGRLDRAAVPVEAGHVRESRRRGRR